MPARIERSKSSNKSKAERITQQAISRTANSFRLMCRIIQPKAEIVKDSEGWRGDRYQSVFLIPNGKRPKPDAAIVLLLQTVPMRRRCRSENLERFSDARPALTIENGSIPGHDYNTIKAVTFALNSKLRPGQIARVKAPYAPICAGSANLLRQNYATTRDPVFMRAFFVLSRPRRTSDLGDGFGDGLSLCIKPRRM
jgi:hypothetical protein